MLIQLTRKGSIEILGIEGEELHLLRMIPQAGDPADDPRAERRLFPLPSDPGEESIVEDWVDLVHPDLRRLFESHREKVRRDLASMTVAENKAGKLVISADHIEAWINALNQARLVLAEHYAFTDDELALNRIPGTATRRDLVLWQIHFYAELQEQFIQAAED